MAEIETKDASVTFDDSPEAKEKAFAMLRDFFVKHRAFSGESVCQNDAPQINAPDLLAKLADRVFKFKVAWKDE